MFRRISGHIHGSELHYRHKYNNTMDGYSELNRDWYIPKLLVLIIRDPKSVIKRRVILFHTIKRDRLPSEEATLAFRRVYVPAGIKNTA